MWVVLPVPGTKSSTTSSTRRRLCCRSTRAVPHHLRCLAASLLCSGRASSPIVHATCTLRLILGTSGIASLRACASSFTIRAFVCQLSQNTWKLRCGDCSTTWLRTWLLNLCSQVVVTFARAAVDSTPQALLFPVVASDASAASFKESSYKNSPRGRLSPTRLCISVEKLRLCTWLPLRALCLWTCSLYSWSWAASLCFRRCEKKG